MDDRIEERLMRLETGQAEIKSTLAHFEPMLTKILDGQSSLNERMARIEGRMSDMPTARDFGRLEGRVAEMSERLPTTIGYAPPPGRKRA